MQNKQMKLITYDQLSHQCSFSSELFSLHKKVYLTLERACLVYTKKVYLTFERELVQFTQKGISYLQKRACLVYTKKHIIPSKELVYYTKKVYLTFERELVQSTQRRYSLPSKKRFHITWLMLQNKICIYNNLLIMLKL